MNKFISKINKRDKFNPYIIAEIGVNHEGSIAKAKKMIDLAKKGGADCVKFQTYKAHLLASKHSPSYWDQKKKKLKVSINYSKSSINLIKKIMLC